MHGGSAPLGVLRGTPRTALARRVPGERRGAARGTGRRVAVKAMILAAGVGSRLRPLTDETPKALIDVGGVPMIERVIRCLTSAGVSEIVINLFHLADRIVEFLASKGHFGLRIEFTREAE